MPGGRSSTCEQRGKCPTLNSRKMSPYPLGTNNSFHFLPKFGQLRPSRSTNRHIYLVFIAEPPPLHPTGSVRCALLTAPFAAYPCKKDLRFGPLGGVLGVYADPASLPRSDPHSKRVVPRTVLWGQHKC